MAEDSSDLGDVFSRNDPNDLPQISIHFFLRRGGEGGGGRPPNPDQNDVRRISDTDKIRQTNPMSENQMLGIAQNELCASLRPVAPLFEGYTSIQNFGKKRYLRHPDPTMV